MRRLIALSAAIAGLVALTPGATLAANAPQPRIAVLNFDSQGLTSWWGPNFDPGAALAALLTDQLVNSNNFQVVDRSHIDAIMQEKNLTVAGDISPATEMQIGHLIGARYLIVGRIVQFDKTGQNGGAVGGLMGGVLGGSGVSGEKVTLNVAMHVIDVNTGAIVQAVGDERSHVSTSFALAGFSGYTGAVYESQQFLSTSMGKLINESAQNLAGKVDAQKLASASTAPAVTGKIIEVDGDSVILNIGSDQGVQPEMFFNVVSVKYIRDPDTGKMLQSTINKGEVQIVSVDAHTSVAKRVSGSASSGLTVQGQ